MPSRQRSTAEVEPVSHDVLRRGAFVGGPTVAAFEQEFAGYLGVAALRRASPTAPTPLELALRAVGVARAAR